MVRDPIRLHLRRPGVLAEEVQEHLIGISTGRRVNARPAFKRWHPAIDRGSRRTEHEVRRRFEVPPLPYWFAPSSARSDLDCLSTNLCGLKGQGTALTRI